MDAKTLYQQRLIRISEAVGLLQSNQTLATAVIGSEPPGLLTELSKHKDRLTNVDIYMGFALRPYDYLMKNEMAGHFNLKSFFYGAAERAAHKVGRVSYLPGNLGENTSNVLYATKSKINYFWGTATPPDSRGYMSLSLGLVGERQLIDAADVVILEINENLPWTYGDTIIHISEVDFVVENHAPLIDLPKGVPADWEKQIGHYIAEMIEDGSTLQLGIGGIPDAISTNLMAKKDLGIHTEMLTSGIVDLYNAGVITGKYKTLWKEKIICAFALGNKELYHFMDRNPIIEVHQGQTVNNPYIIGKNYKQVSVNTAIMVDINGQVCSQSLGPLHYSGTGGQLDYHLGARISKGGRGIIALRSTAKDNTVSAIVPILPLGSEITITAHQVDTIVTEYGSAELIGKTVRERMEALIKIAHPDFRDWIRDEADRLGMVPKINFPPFEIRRNELKESDTGVTKDKIKIGSILDLSGPNSLVGIDILHGFESYVRYINSSGGINGREIELIVKDDGFNPNRTKKAAVSLVEDDQVFALASILGTPTNLSIYEYLSEKQIPVICPHSGVSTWSKPMLKNYFSYQMSYDTEGKILAQYAVDFLKSKKIAVFAVGDQIGKEGSSGFIHELEKMGINPVGFIVHSPDTDKNEPKKWVETLKSYSPDLVLLFSYIKPVSELLSEAYFAGLKTQWLGSYILSGESLFKLDYINAIEGVRTATYPFGPSYHRGERLFRKYMKRDYHSENPGTFSMMGFTSAQLLTEGLMRCGQEITRKKFIESMESLKNWTGGIFPPISYSQTDHMGIKSLSIQKVINGKWTREQVEIKLKESGE